ncbi:tetraacyldisaccharide 4'-kinase [bacterium]|nr:tetraacyldisaccharide 4'-kinase [candidate division CSSED10-310 bacterium]
MDPLQLLARIYEGATRLRLAAYDTGMFSTHLPVPVISVGNLTTGGTGKTPFTISLARRLLAGGHRPVILSRGYNRTGRAPIAFVSNRSQVLLSPAEAGDEPYMMARRLPGVPVVVGPRRRLTGWIAMERFDPGCMILDDGFQHRAVARDLDIVLLDGGIPLDKARLLPAGPLREPLSSLLRAQLVIISHATEHDIDPMAITVARVAPHLAIAAGHHEPDVLVAVAGGATIPAATLKGRSIAAFCGIARPDAFRRTLVALGARVTRLESFRDHHHYRPQELSHICARASREGAELVVTTEKDAVKIPNVPAAPPLYYLSIDFKLIKGTEYLDRALDDIGLGGA